MMGRLLAVCGWLAWRIGRPFGRFARPVTLAIAGLLVLLAALPIVIPLLDPQPADVGVQRVFDGSVPHPEGWVRLEGRVVPLAEPAAEGRGPYGLLIDAEQPLRAVVVRGDAAADAADLTMVTGRLVPATVAVDAIVADLPIEATVAGTPPRVVGDRLVELDPIATPPRTTWWALSILPALLAAALVTGASAGYPIFRRTSEVDVLAAPLAVGDRLPAAYGGRVGSNERPMTDPGGALVLVRRGPKGNLLTAQPLPEDGRPAPPPVTIGGGWTAGRIGYVFTPSEVIPALHIRSELVDATFLFARVAERDRVAALITLER